MSLSPEQKALRLQGVGGSEVAAVAGLDPFRGPLDVYLSKVEGKEFEGNFHTERGTFMEPGVAAWYAHRTGSTLREVGTIVHPRNPLVLCTPDRLALKEEERDLSIKVPGPHAFSKWGEAGTEDIPDSYFIQVQWELIALRELYGIRRAHVAAPIDGDLRIYPVEADESLQGQLVEQVERFWRNHVLTKTPPPVDGTTSSTEWLAERFPQAMGEVLTASDDAESWVQRLKAAKAEKAKAEALEEEAKNRLKAMIGHGSVMEGRGWKASWGNVKASSYVVNKEAGRSFRLTFKGKS
jgi:putative phage-type endonuclease